jgi:hypothetical protein
VSDAQFGCHSGEADVGRPNLVTLQDRGGEKVSINPPQTSARESSRTHESDDFSVSDSVRLMHLRVGGEKLAAPADVADEKFAEYQGVPDHFIKIEEPIEFGGVGLTIAKESNPNRRIGQDHHATLRLAGVFRATPSRRRGTSRACGSLPRSAFSRW